MTGLIKDKAITLKRNIQPDLPTVRADAIRVRQVMINLLSNAAKFTDEGEIVVDVEVKPSLSGRPELVVSVTDTGPGISPQDQAKLFQPFSQVDDSPTRKTGGTGLGLSICQHLIQMHGGRIGVHSAPGKGSTFYFTLLHRREKENEMSNGKGSGHRRRSSGHWSLTNVIPATGLPGHLIDRSICAGTCSPAKTVCGHADIMMPH
jgi:signal transduction histidine kinase